MHIEKFHRPPLVFCPFELLYRWDVLSPLDLLRKSWEGPFPSHSDRGVVQYVLEMRNWLAEYHQEAEVNLQEAQRKQKTWYDLKARHREFLPGQKVLLLLPSSTNKLLAKWQGPYMVLHKTGPFIYEVYHLDKKKSKQTYHLNLVKTWKERPAEVPENSGFKVLMVQPVNLEEAGLQSRLSHRLDLQRTTKSAPLD